jgi:hypothetical protein
MHARARAANGAAALRCAARRCRRDDDAAPRGKRAAMARLFEATRTGGGGRAGGRADEGVLEYSRRAGGRAGRAKVGSTHRRAEAGLLEYSRRGWAQGKAGSITGQHGGALADRRRDFAEVAQHRQPRDGAAELRVVRST